MGSTDKAVITGFICRLCSKMNRFVIHIYGEEGERMKLAEKINAYLPITVKMNDPLPKTACLHCIERLEAHHELMEQFMLARRRLAAENKTHSLPISTSSSTSTTSSSSSSSSMSAAPSTNVMTTIQTTQQQAQQQQQSSVVEAMPAPSLPPCSHIP